MPLKVPISGQSFVDHLSRDGYVLLPRWRCEETTIAIGRSIGVVTDIQALLPQSNISTVQTLEPRNVVNSSNNHYSGTFGFDEFPLHTDLAHWARPPRYFILRCQNGSRSVVTKLLAFSTLATLLNAATLRQALLRPRRTGRDGTLCLLPFLFHVDGVYGFRWDSLFLVPMNEAAKKIAEIILTRAWHLSQAETLVKRGDTLIVDNWRILHGRGKVTMIDADRQLERVYLSKIYI